MNRLECEPRSDALLSEEERQAASRKVHQELGRQGYLVGVFVCCVVGLVHILGAEFWTRHEDAFLVLCFVVVGGPLFYPAIWRLTSRRYDW